MKSISQKKEEKRNARHQRIRKSVVGTPDQPRLCVHRSLKNFYAQVVDDSQGKILFGSSTLNKDVRSKVKFGGNVAGAKELGVVVAGMAKKKGVTKVCFDRGGYMYHGRVKAFAEAARENGLEF
ncbi:MAG: 50S ribosomal protein L18 [Candidatus Omnitrophica bacterium]|nr:50S ribosomal protein L18 [Candidatus Omnitrophota bacterium]